MANKRRQPITYRPFRVQPLLAEGLLSVERGGGELERKVAQAFFRVADALGDRNDRAAERAGALAGQLAALEGRPSVDIELPEGAAFRTNDPVAQDLPAEARAFLNAVAGGESAGSYNVRYTPDGGATFSDLSQHPRIFETRPDGRKSSAAGRYQFTASTWDMLGGGPFSPENQDRRAWELAQKDYFARTGGRNLLADLRREGLTKDMLSALSPTWEAFNSNRGRHIATYNDSLLRFTGQGTAAPPSSAPATVDPAVQAPKIVAAQGSFRPSGSDTIYGRAFDAAGTRTYLQALDQEIERTQSEVYERYKDDPATLAEAFRALKDVVGEEHVFDEIRADYELAFDRSAGAYVMQAQRDLEKRREAENRAQFLERTAALEEDQAKALAALDPENPASIAQLKRTQAAIDDHYDAAVAHGIMDAHEAGEAKRLSQGRTAAGFYYSQATALDSEGVADFRKRMKEDYGAGKLDGIDAEAFDRLDGALVSLERQKKIEESQAAKDLAERAANMTSRIEQGFVADPAELSRLQLDAKTAPDGEKILARSLKVMQMAEAIRDRPLPEASAYVAEKRAALGKNPSEADLAAVQYGEARLAELAELADKDPVGYEISTGRVKLQPIDTSSPDALRQSLTLRRDQMEHVAEQYGRPLEVLRPAERTALARELVERPEGFPDFVVTLRQVFGEEATTVLAEISPDAPPLAHAAGVAIATGDMSVAQDVAAALSAKAQGAYSAKLPAEGKFAAAAGPQLAGALSFLDRTRAAALSTAMLVYEREANMAGFDPTTIDDPATPAGQAWQRALNRALGAQFTGGRQTGGLSEVNGYPIVVPAGMETGRPQELVSGLTEEDLKKLPKIRSGNGVPVTASQLRNAHLVTVGDGRYRVALGDPNGWDPQWLIGEDGDFWVLDLDELAAIRDGTAAAERRSRAERLGRLGVTAPLDAMRAGAAAASLIAR